jgi:hypothetical protein
MAFVSATVTYIYDDPRRNFDSHSYTLTQISIGDNVNITQHALGSRFLEAYTSNERAAGDYNIQGGLWGLAGTEKERQRRRNVLRITGYSVAAMMALFAIILRN